MMIAIAAIAVLATFFRPEAHKDPALLSVIYGALIVAALVQLVIYAIGCLDFSAPGRRESSKFGIEVERQRGTDAPGDEDLV
jgi:hypothetical protein